MHSRNVVQRDIYDAPSHVDKAKVSARQTIARTHRVWPTCEECGTDLEIMSEPAFGKANIVLVCPKR